MPAYKDSNKTKNIWYVKLTYHDNTGESHQKTKRGFNTKKAALDWEKDFLESHAYSTNKEFESMLKIYFEDCESKIGTKRMKYTTYEKKQRIFADQITPYFKGMIVTDIDNNTIRKWHNSLLEKRTKQNQPYSENYLNKIHKQLSAFFNFLVKYYNLPKNPACDTGNIAKPENREEMKIWTVGQFNAVLSNEDNLQYKLALNILFWTGMRKGELRALRWQDIDFKNNQITIENNLQKVDNENEALTPTKTYEKRTISINKDLVELLKDWYSKQYSPKKTDFLFHYSKNCYGKELHRLADLIGIECIRVHDLRHSHASFLINNNVEILLISKRLGHKSVKMTLDTYSHLYPDKSLALGETIQELINKENEKSG